MRRLPTALLIIVEIVSLHTAVDGQTIQKVDESTQPRFEVASVKPNRSGVPQMTIATSPSGSIHATNVNTRFLIRYAFNVQDFLIANAPDWASSEHFDVAAKGPANTTEARARDMFRSLLVERFRLDARREPREMAVDVLTLASDRLGPNLTPSKGPCASPPCHARASFGHIEGKAVPVSELAAALTLLTRRVVVDRTGLAAPCDFTLTYTPDAIVLQPTVRSEFPAVDPDGPSLATALRQQLGITMLTTREPVDMVVIDHIERPDPD